MSKVECQFFPGMPAQWRCNQCGTLYGKTCIPAGHSRHWGHNQPACIRCTKPLNYLGNATDAKPFWQKLAHFFAYPLQSQSLLVMALITVLNTFLNSGFIGVVASLFSFAVIIKYGFAIITERGKGSSTAPDLAQVIGGDSEHLFLRQMLFMFVMALAVVFAGRVTPLLGLVVLAFFTLALPASIMMLAVDKSVRRALNPMALTSLMLTVGWPYWLLWFCCQCILAGPYIIASVVIGDAEHGPAGVGTFLAINFITVYFSVVFYTMLGYVLFQYQHELGYNPDNEDDSDLSHDDFIKARVLGEVAMLVSDQKYQQARHSLRSALDAVKDDTQLHQRYHKLLMLLEDDDALSNHGEYLIGLLMAERQTAHAVSVVLDIQSRLPAFKLTQTDTALTLAKLMVAQGHYRNAVRLLHNLHKHQPNDRLIPAAYLLVARTLSEFLGDAKNANAIVRYTLSQYPDCQERQEFKTLLAITT